MSSRLVFMSWILGHLVSRFSCRKCGNAEECKTVHYPMITRRGDQVELRYRVECGCGQTGWLRVQLPILLFGFLLAWQILFEADKRGRAPHVPVQVIGQQSKLFPRLLGEYMRLISALPATGTTTPTAADQAAFELNDQAWTDFLKRMGFDGDAPAES